MLIPLEWDLNSRPNDSEGRSLPTSQAHCLNLADEKWALLWGAGWHLAPWTHKSDFSGEEGRNLGGKRERKESIDDLQHTLLWFAHSFRLILVGVVKSPGVLKCRILDSSEFKPWKVLWKENITSSKPRRHLWGRNNQKGFSRMWSRVKQACSKPYSHPLLGKQSNKTLLLI